MGGTNTMKATWSEATKTLELSAVRTGNVNGTRFQSDEHGQDVSVGRRQSADD